ncbi:hypothetical protein [Pseudoalteromonas sp. S16_S37]|uniref:hypothetical protein n=1 Tax=Pseudoalteromonas sp. S16_S37 TaxID=2720228 RepID=UPI001680F2CD|nr:hypothetical protein [Pseudoalteromonas sp. S16_S37]MBD1583312.1 hypothetical protein [Pseudoalteromonas sp. S16_S37]
MLGSPGAGKSTIAKEIAELSALPLIHLDDLYWGENWCRPSESVWHEQLSNLVQQEQWLIDGNHLTTLNLRLPRAELVLIVDSTVPRSLYRVYLRALKIKLGFHQYLPKRIREQADKGERTKATKDLLGLTKKIVKYHYSDHQVLMAQLLHYDVQTVIVSRDVSVRTSLFLPFLESKCVKVRSLSLQQLKQSFDSGQIYFCSKHK